jgi:hypothetical protein
VNGLAAGRRRRRIRACQEQITVLVEVHGSTLLRLRGTGPTGAARLMADVGGRDEEIPGLWPL